MANTYYHTPRTCNTELSLTIHVLDAGRKLLLKAARARVTAIGEVEYLPEQYRFAYSFIGTSTHSGVTGVAPV